MLAASDSALRGARSSRNSARLTRLVELTDGDFAAMLRGDANVRPGIAQPPGGVDEPAVLGHVRRLAGNLHRSGYAGGHWMMVANGEAVGLCGFHGPPSNDGDVEIGYSVAARRRGRGHATAAVKAMVELAAADPAVRALVAITAVGNVSSQRVLTRNGFERAGRYEHPEDGPSIVWRKTTSAR